jgi:hypothetical protein
MSCFDIRDFSQLVDRASIYEESLMEKMVEYADLKWLKELVLRLKKPG